MSGTAADRGQAAIWRVHGAPLVPPLARGSLDGLTVAVKDLFAVAGFPVGAGNPAWLREAAPETADAAAVHALRAAGAALAGIAHTDELAFSLSGTNVHYGTPPNAAAPDRVPGGSTSGPAAAVAAGAADIGLGTDTAGSIRVPAAACRLFGLRPTHGAVAMSGVLPLAPSFDTVGWLARDPGALARIGDVLLPAASPTHPTRLAHFDPLPPGAAELARALDLALVPLPVSGHLDRDALLSAFRTVQSAEAWATHGGWIAAHPGALGADVEARFRFGAGVSEDARTVAAAQIAQARTAFLTSLDGAWLVLPVGPAHPRDADAATKDAWRMATLRETVIASAFGLPSCVLPLQSDPPAGLAIVGPPGADRALLTAARLAGAPATSGVR